MKHLRISLVIAVVLALLACNTALAADPIVIRLAHGETEIDMWETPTTALTTVFKNQVERNSNGRIKVEVYPAGQLGDYASLVSQVQKNLLTAACFVNVGIYATHYPDIQAFEIPYLFRNPQIANAVLDNGYEKEVSDKMAAATNIRILAMWVAAMRNFSNSKQEIRTPADMEGMRIRVMPIPVHIQTVEALGASATPIAYSELYTALQTGVVEGQDNPPFAVRQAKFYEVQKYMSLDGHFANFSSICINEKFLQSLTQEDRKIVEDAAKKAKISYIGINYAKEEDDLTFLSSKMKVTALSREEFLQFRDKALQPVVDYLKKNISPAEVDTILNAVDGIDGSK